MAQGAVIALLLSVGLATPVAMGSAVPILPGFEGVLDQDGFVTVLGVDSIPAVVDPRFVDGSWLSGGERILGVEINGDVRAYPISILTWHEIVNDVVGGVPVAATYCPLCGTGIVYDRRVDGRTLTFHVSGKLYRNDLVMLDSETGSLWPQVLGKAATGPLVGRELQLITSTVTTWNAWRGQHPISLLLARPRCGEGIPTRCIDPPFQRDYTSNPYAGYGTSPATLFPRPYGNDGSSLGPKEIVLGVLVNRTAKAYPYMVLERNPVVNDVVGGVALVVTFVEGAGHAFEAGGHSFTHAREGSMRAEDGGLWDMAAGTSSGRSLTPVRAIPSFWFAWHDFYPDTQGFGFQVGSLRNAPAGGGSGNAGPFGLLASFSWIILPAVVLASGAAALLIRFRGKRLGRTRR